MPPHRCTITSTLTAGCLVVAFLIADGPPIVRGAVVVEWRPQTSGVGGRLRGVSAVSARTAWASGANGAVLRTVDGGRTWQTLRVAGAETLDFRDVDAITDRVAYVLSIGSGESSRIYKTVDAGANWELQFRNADPKAFFDAMAFRDERHGVAFSDSVDGHFVLLTTSNGRSWDRVPVDRLPPARPGEGAYAASGTNVTLTAGHMWIGTTAGRVLRSADDGRTWTIATTGVATGGSAGIFSVAFRDALHGVVVGGDYQQESAAVDNAAWTSDGGATWTLVKGRGLSGFRSVVAFVSVADRPNATALIAIGPTGADWSDDDGRTWTRIECAGFDTFSAAPGGHAGWAAGQGGRISGWSVP